MAIRSIRTIGDPILEKKTKPVKEMTDRIKDLISDMFETMYDANGGGRMSFRSGKRRTGNSPHAYSYEGAQSEYGGV